MTRKCVCNFDVILILFFSKKKEKKRFRNRKCEKKSKECSKSEKYEAIKADKLPKVCNTHYGAKPVKDNYFVAFSSSVTLFLVLQ